MPLLARRLLGVAEQALAAVEVVEVAVASVCFQRGWVPAAEARAADRNLAQVVPLGSLGPWGCPVGFVIEGYTPGYSSGSYQWKRHWRSRLQSCRCQ